MSFGLAIYDSSQNLVWQTPDAFDGVVIGIHDVPTNTTPTFTYPSLAGRSVFFYTINSEYNPGVNTDIGDYDVSSDTALGYPRVTVTAAKDYKRTLVVMADH